MNLMHMPIVPRAKCVALLAHESVGQCRKYGRAHYGPERYYFHPCRVAELVATVTDNDAVIAAAALHDVLEDVSIKSEVFTPRYLLDFFGAEVLRYVMECTNVYSKDEAQRRVLLSTIDLLFGELYNLTTHKQLTIAAFTVADTANRKQRKRLEAERYGTISENAKIIKRADLFDNSLSMDGAPASFVEKWMAEKELAESLIGSWDNYKLTVQEHKRAGIPVPV